MMRCRRDATGKHGAGRDGLRNAGLRTDRCAVADLDVIHHAHLPGKRNVLAQAAAAGDARLRGNY